MIRFTTLIPSLVGSVLLFVGSSLAANAVNVTIVQNFDGTRFGDLGANSSLPPDTMGAIGATLSNGNKYFTEFTNNTFSIYNANTTALVLQQSANTFWSNAGVPIADNSNLADPRILYDPSSSRYFAAQTTQNQNINNNFLLAVSSTNDPTGAWKAFSILNTNGTFADFPTLGLNGSGVYLASDNSVFDTNTNTFSYVNLSLLSIPKVDLLSANPTVSNSSFFQGVDLNNHGLTFQPVVDFSGGNPTSADLLAISNTTFGQSIFSQINDPGALGATLSPLVTVVNIPFYNAYPPSASQPDTNTLIDTGFPDFTSNVVRVGNSIWATHSFEDNARAAISWYKFDATSKQLLQSGKIGDANHDYYYPSIAVNSLGNVVIGFTRSGETEFASSYAVVGETVNGVTSFDNPLLLQAGLASYTKGLSPVRWGDYSATIVDPDNPLRFWTAQQYASTGNIWATRITALDIQAVPESSSIFSLLAFGAIGAVSVFIGMCKKNNIPA